MRRAGRWSFDAIGLTDEDLLSVVIDRKHLWALGTTSLIQKDLATGAWRSIPLPVTSGIWRSLAVRIDSDATAVELVMVGHDCAGLSYLPTTQLFSPGPRCFGPADLTTAAFVAGELLVGAEQGVILRRNGSVFDYEAVPAALTKSIRSLVVDGNSMWGVGERGLLLRRSGTVWSYAATDVTTHTLFAGTHDDQGLFVVGTGGSVLKGQ